MTGFANKCSELALKAYIKADIAKDRAKKEISEFKGNESGVSGLVVSLILIAIAVALGIIFKDKIAVLMDKIFNKTDDMIDNL